MADSAEKGLRRPKVEFIVIRPQIVGNMDRGFETVYYSDLVRRTSREAAIRHGWKAEGHDDWLLAHVRGDVLVGVSWQYEDRYEPNETAKIAETFGWEARVIPPCGTDTGEVTS